MDLCFQFRECCCIKQLYFLYIWVICLPTQTKLTAAPIPRNLNPDEMIVKFMPLILLVSALNKEPQLENFWHFSYLYDLYDQSDFKIMIYFSRFYLSLKTGMKGERGKHMPHNRRPALQLWQWPCLGIEPATFQFAVWCPIHWATPPGADNYILIWTSNIISLYRKKDCSFLF